MISQSNKSHPTLISVHWACGALARKPLPGKGESGRGPEMGTLLGLFGTFPQKKSFYLFTQVIIKRFRKS